MLTVPHDGSPPHPEPTLLDAMRAFRALAAPRRLRVIRDSEGWPAIPGKLGRLEWHDDAELAVYTDRPRLFPRLWAVPGVRRWQVGDHEARGVLPVAALPTVAALIRARRCRFLSPEAARKRSGLPTVRASSAA
jgi:hypothetical protein